MAGPFKPTRRDCVQEMAKFDPFGDHGRMSRSTIEQLLDGWREAERIAIEARQSLARAAQCGRSIVPTDFEELAATVRELEAIAKERLAAALAEMDRTLLIAQHKEASQPDPASHPRV